MKNTAVASRYATALLELAVDLKKVDSVAGDMEFIVATNSSSRDFELLIQSPIIRADKKIEIFSKIFDAFEDISMGFVRLITNKGREKMLPDIAEAFGLLVKEHKGIVPVTLTTAQKLDSATRDKILSKIQGMLDNMTPELEEIIDESLIGGFIVRVGDKQVDASISSQFNNLKQRLTR